jgi:SAM-dependent methyltransferase
MVFGEVAHLYDRARPQYPAELFDDVFGYGALSAGDRALELGAGTGKATRAIAARGLAVTAIEPSAEMAAVLRTSTTATVVETAFETFDVEAGEFRLCFAAQAWHWMDPRSRAERVAHALVPGGTVALFWNLARPFAEPVAGEVQAVYDAIAPDVEPLTTQWPLDDTLDELAAARHFDAVEKRVYRWSQVYPTSDYLDLMSTHSSHRMIDDETRNRLVNEIGAVLERHGGHAEVGYDTALYLARRI